MNDLKKYLDKRLSKVTVSPELKEKLLQKPFVEERKPANPFQIAAIAAACLCLLLAIPLGYTLYSQRESEPSSATSTSATSTTIPTNHSLDQKGSMAGDLDGDDKADVVTISEIASGIRIEVTLGTGKRLQHDLPTGGSFEAARCLDVDQDGMDELFIVLEDGGKKFYVFNVTPNGFEEISLPQYFDFEPEILDGYRYQLNLQALHYGHRQYPMPEALRNTFYGDYGKAKVHDAGTDPVSEYIWVEDTLILHQVIWAGDHQTLGVAKVTLRWDPETKAFKPVAQRFDPVEEMSEEKPEDPEQAIEQFLTAMQNKEILTLRKFISFGDICEQAILDMDIGGFRYQKKETGVYTVYLDIDNSKVREFPVGKNRQYKLVLYNDGDVREFSPAGRKVVAPTRGKVPTEEIKKQDENNVLYQRTYDFVSIFYDPGDSGPVEIDMANYPNGLDLMNMFYFVISEEEYREKGGLPVDELKKRAEKVCRIKNFDPFKIDRYIPETGMVPLLPRGGLAVNFDITKVEQQGKVYTVWVDQYADVLESVVSCSFILTMRDNGDGTFFYDKVETTYISPYEYWAEGL